MITDFSMTNILWFKFPVKKTTIPEKILIAACVSALQPTIEFIARYEEELSALRSQGKISEESYRNFIYNASVKEHLLNLTRGDADELTDQQIEAAISAYEERIAMPYKEESASLKTALTKEQMEKDAATRMLSEQEKIIESLETTTGVVQNNIEKYIRSTIQIIALVIVIIIATLESLLASNASETVYIGFVVLGYTIMCEVGKRFEFNEIDISGRLAKWLYKKISTNKGCTMGQPLK